MSANKVTSKFAQIQLRGKHGLQRLDVHSHGWLGMIFSAINQTLNPNTATTAAAIAYFSLLSLFPIVLLSISIASFSIGPQIDQHVTLQKLEFIAPALSKLLGNNIDEIILNRGPVTGLALIGLVWSASTVFYTFTHTLTEIWDIKRRRAVWKRRGLAVLFVVALVGPALFLASFFSSMLTNLSTWLPEQIIQLWGGISFFVAIFLDITLFMLLYIMLPHGTATWREILPGAIGAGLLWEVAKKAFLYFITSYFSISNLVYGSVTAIIAFLLWAYVSGLIFLFGAFLSVKVYQYKHKLPEGTVPPKV